MVQHHILLVEDEPNIAQGLVFNLELDGYRVTHVESGEAALAALAKQDFSLVILDLMLPGISGWEVCQQLREADDQMPVLMLTARGEEADRVRGLLLGADDYLTKPFNLDELLLRVAGMLRRRGWYREQTETGEYYRFGANLVALDGLRADTPAGEVELTDLEIRMLRYFFDHEGKVVGRGELLKAVWGVAPDTQTRTLDNFIVRLRKYFENDPAEPRHFLTVRGRGYRFVREPED